MGGNTYGQLGNGTYSVSSTPTPVQAGGLTGIVAIAAGSDYAVALKSDGTAWMWDGNNWGQLGIDSQE